MFNSIIMNLPFITSESDKEEAQNDEQADRGDNVSDEEDDDSTTVH
jgi:hypothetical protein